MAVCAVNRLVCDDCGTVYYSAAAKTLAEQGETCPKCGGRLILKDDEGRVSVSGPPAAGNGENA